MLISASGITITKHKNSDISQQETQQKQRQLELGQALQQLLAPTSTTNDQSSFSSSSLPTISMISSMGSTCSLDQLPVYEFCEQTLFSSPEPESTNSFVGNVYDDVNHHHFLTERDSLQHFSTYTPIHDKLTIVKTNNKTTTPKLNRTRKVSGMTSTIQSYCRAYTCIIVHLGSLTTGTVAKKSKTSTASTDDEQQSTDDEHKPSPPPTIEWDLLYSPSLTSSTNADDDSSTLSLPTIPSLSSLIYPAIARTWNGYEFSWGWNSPFPVEELANVQKETNRNGNGNDNDHGGDEIQQDLRLGQCEIANDKDYDNNNSKSNDGNEFGVSSPNNVNIPTDESAEGAGWWKAVTEPGDVLIIPPFWWFPHRPTAMTTGTAVDSIPVSKQNDYGDGQVDVFLQTQRCNSGQDLLTFFRHNQPTSPFFTVQQNQLEEKMQRQGQEEDHMETEQKHKRSSTQDANYWKELVDTFFDSLEKFP